MLLRQYRKTIQTGRSMDRSTEIVCVACQKIKPLVGSKTGSVYSGLVVKTIETVEINGQLNISGFDTVEDVRVVQKKVRFPGRERGTICVDCQANSHYVLGEDGSHHPWIKLDMVKSIDRREWFKNERSVEYAEGSKHQLGKVQIRFK